jgi:hypothetical protein
MDLAQAIGAVATNLPRVNSVWPVTMRLEAGSPGGRLALQVEGVAFLIGERAAPVVAQQRCDAAGQCAPVDSSSARDMPSLSYDPEVDSVFSMEFRQSSANDAHRVA